MDRRSPSSDVGLIGALGVGAMCCVAPPCSAGSAAESLSPEADPYTWLEQRQGERALKWVHEQNRRSLEELKRQRSFSRYYKIALKNAQSKGDIPNFGPGSVLLGDWVYQLWQDEGHPRGQWRRVRRESVGETKVTWDVVLDLDALAIAERQPWLFDGVEFAPGGEHCMIKLAAGGDTAGAWREFDIAARAFVPAGFELPTTKHSTVAWRDSDTLLVALYGGSNAEGEATMVVKLWTRGHAYSEAKEVVHADVASTILNVESAPSPTTAGLNYISEYSLQNGRVQQKRWRLSGENRPERMNLPSGIQGMSIYKGRWVFTIGQDWRADRRAWKSGSLLSISDSDVTLDSPPVKTLMEPEFREAISQIRATSEGLLVAAYSDARGRLWRFSLDEKGDWVRAPIDTPANGTIRIVASDPTAATAFITYEDFLQPRTLYEVDMRSGHATPLKSLASQFNPSPYVTERIEATSKDGTEVPYFVVRRRNVPGDGSTPTLVFAYGGNNIPMYPQYSGDLGRLWLDQGGAYVLANIRGGGEFGPEWHEAALKTNRQRSYDDFVAVAEDLIGRGITSPARLGIYGFSNGGLVMGVVLNQRPDLFNAAILSVGVLDTMRVDLMSSRTVIAERGSPDVPQERAFLEQTSPYQNLRKREHFPVPLLMTSSTDEIVHPAMTRKYAAKMEALDMPFFYYESMEGGHSVSATPQEQALEDAIMYTYLAERLIKGRALSRGRAGTNSCSNKKSIRTSEPGPA